MKKSNENGEIRVSFSILLLAIAIIIICIMGAYIHKVNEEKDQAVGKVEVLVNRVAQLENEQKEKNNVIETNTIANSIVTNTTTNNNANEVKNQFTNDQIKTSVQNYFDLKSASRVSMLLETLENKGKLSFDDSKWVMGSDFSKWTTDVKLSDYKNAMLNFVSEEEYERNWNPTKSSVEVGIEVNQNGYIIPPQGGGYAPNYSVKNVVENGENKYIIGVDYTSMNSNNEEQTVDAQYYVTVKNYNGNCVIDSVNE